MRILTRRALDRMFTVLLVTTLIRVLVFPAPLVAYAAETLIAELDDDVRITDSGRAVETDGIHLATIAGNALISTATPVTLDSVAPQRKLALAPRVTRSRVRVPAGTTFRVVTTGYSSTPDQTDASPFITANGTRVHDGTLAANFLPFGTKVKFPEYTGDKVFIVEDRTNPRYGSRADLWFPTRQAALTHGKRTLRMVVVE